MIHNLGHAVVNANQKTMAKAAHVADVEHKKALKAAVGSDMRMSNVGKNRGRKGNAKLGIAWDFKGSQVSPDVVIRATGAAWPLIERNTAPHMVRSAYLPGSRRRRAGITYSTGGRRTWDRRAVLNLGGSIGFRRSVMHPGTKGKKPFQKGVDQAKPRVTRIIRTRTFRAIKQGARPS